MASLQSIFLPGRHVVRNDTLSPCSRGCTLAGLTPAEARCPWCKGRDSDDPSDLCRTHLAEYEGLSVAELDRRDTEQAAELADL